MSQQLSRILLAPTAFKGSLTPQQAAAAFANACRAHRPTLQVTSRAVADGGEGVLDCLADPLELQRRDRAVTGPLGEPLIAAWGLGPADHRADCTAVIETASAAGFIHVPPGSRNPLHTTTFGLGEMIREAIHAGATRIYLALGGSATCDAGAGLAQAIGYRLLDVSGDALPNPVTPAALARLDRIEPPADWDNLPEVIGLSDVDNPLLGPAGAAPTFAPQKGANPQDIPVLERALERVRTCAEAAGLPTGHADTPGAGAAGGLGWAVLTFLRGSLRPGAPTVLGLLDVRRALEQTDLVVVGEGRLDHTSLRGKATLAVARLASELEVPVAAIVGSASPDAHAMHTAFRRAGGPLIAIEELTRPGEQPEDAMRATLARIEHAVAKLLDRLA